MANDHTENPLTRDYWEHRWQTGQTGWDIGYAAPAIMAFMKKQADKNAAILIPGCGNAYEATALLDMGFTNITLLDISPAAVDRLNKKFAGSISVICTDFFEHTGTYDIILEQTFFCALNPDLRTQYVSQMYRLLNVHGILSGLLFGKEFAEAGPPFGATLSEYRKLFAPFFDIHHLEPCVNSIPQRSGAELFMELQKKYSIA